MTLTPVTMTLASRPTRAPHGRRAALCRAALCRAAACLAAACQVAAFALVLLVLLVPGTAHAQDMEAAMKDGTNSYADGKPAATSPAVNFVETAAELASYGLRESDPVALVAAARILVQQGATPSSSAALDGAPADVDTDAKDTPAVAFTPQGLLGAARTMAEGNDEVTALIDATASTMGQARGRADGPGTFNGRVAARGTASWNLGNFVGGEAAEVRVRGDGDTDLDCYVYDQNGNLVDSDTDTTDYCILRWAPQWTGPFALRIRNLGSVWNAYVGVTN